MRFLRPCESCNVLIRPRTFSQIYLWSRGRACPEQAACSQPRSNSHRILAAAAEPFREWRFLSDGNMGQTAAKDSTIIGIDPDNHGAVAVIRPEPASGSILADASKYSLGVYDMPLEKVNVGKRVRNQVDAAGAVSIIRQILFEAPNTGEVTAYLEAPTPNPTNGLLSVLGTGFSFGVWKGILASHDIKVHACPARRWKADMCLNKAGKEGSRKLALQLFPQAEDFLRRKKDHGRAEALLIVAWALGVRFPKEEITSEISSIESIDSEDGAPLDTKQIGELIVEETNGSMELEDWQASPGETKLLSAS